jgi:uncharacterized Zn finger protein
MYDEENCIFQMTAKQRKIQASKALAALVDQGEDPSPVAAKSRGKIAYSFWGHQWCRNIEDYEDLDYRLVMGRSLLRAGTVLDLKIKETEVRALVFDQEIFEVIVQFTPLLGERLLELVHSLSGEIGSLVDILSGNLSEDIISKLIDKKEGLFPQLDQINLSCNCLDYADLCSHGAAVLYGLGIRFDEKPDLFFGLRGIELDQFIQMISDVMSQQSLGPKDHLGCSLSDEKSQLENLFDIELS